MNHLTDQSADEALEWLASNAQAAAEARERSRVLERAIKATIALEMKKHLSMPISGQEREALASPEYKAICEEFASAEKKASWFIWQRDLMHASLDCWRSFCANTRGVK